MGKHPLIYLMHLFSSYVSPASPVLYIKNKAVFSRHKRNTTKYPDIPRSDVITCENSFVETSAGELEFDSLHLLCCCGCLLQQQMQLGWFF